ncbi:MAG: DASS family sodium-coupled anion symporter [Gemmatimonadota bacterium]|nr:DASS family sodium-coupled anion symporter [Gemmatimonadota bacterium]
MVFAQAARATAGVGVWMAAWWLTEAISIYATALLPLALLPLTGARTVLEAASPYGHPLIFLFMGGFLLALTMQRWGFDRRVALSTLRFAGARPRHIVAGFMAVTAGLSMWVSNTATAVMMLPIAISVIHVAEAGPDQRDRPIPSFAVCLLLGIAYAASIGGVGTLIGTPPNLFLASFIESHLGQEISFVRWMAVGVPFVALFLPITWWLLTHVLHPLDEQPLAGVEDRVADAHAALGRWSRGERITASVFLATAVAWLLRPVLVTLEIGDARPLAGLSDTGIAIAAALVLFATPVDWRRGVYALDWPTAVRLPWGILVLFGGGLSLAGAIEHTGLGAFLGTQVGGLAGIPPLVLTAFVAGLVIFLTELTSNTATTATFLPILAGLAPALGVEVLVLIVPAAIAASCAFMLPVATPPNAVVFGSERITLPQMARAGVWLNLIGIVLITLLTYAIVVPVLLG